MRMTESEWVKTAPFHAKITTVNEVSPRLIKGCNSILVARPQVPRQI